jgi:hypothetical protein
MLVIDAQREVSTVYRGGSIGQTVSSVLWALAAALSTWHSHPWGMATLIIGGFFIFPVTTLLLRLLGRPASLSPENPFRALGIQVAFVLGASLLLLVPVIAFKPDWFFPGAMILVGAHYLPFATLYGQRSFLALGGLLVSGGVLLAMYWTGPLSTGGWLTALVLVLFAVIEAFETRGARTALTT